MRTLSDAATQPIHLRYYITGLIVTWTLASAASLVWSSTGRVAMNIESIGEMWLNFGLLWLLGLLGILIGAMHLRDQIQSSAQMQNALRESQRTFETLLSNLPGMVYRCANDPDWTMQWVSEGGENLTGYPAEDFLTGRVTYAAIIHTADRAGVWDEIQAAVQARRPFQLTYRIITADQKSKWVWEQGRGVFADNQHLLCLEGFITDITERRNAEQEIARRVEQITALNNAGIRIQQQFNPLEIYQTACDELRRFGNFATIYTLTDPAVVRHVFSSMSLDHLRDYNTRFGEQAVDYVIPTTALADELAQVRAGHTIFEHHLLERVLAQATPPIAQTILEWASACGNQGGTLLAPLTQNNQVVALVAVLGEQLSTADIPAVALFAREVSVALDNARLYTETRQRLKELTALYQASATFTHLVDPGLVGKQIIDTIEQLMGYQRGTIWLLDETVNDIQLLAHSDLGYPPNSPQGLAVGVQFRELGKGSSICRWVIEQGEVVRSGNVTGDPRYRLGDPTIQSELCVPLQIGGRTLGAINVESPRADAFTENDERLLTTLASQAAVSIANARLFEAERVRREELSALYDLSSEISMTDSLAATLDVVVRRAVETIHVTCARVLLLEGDALVLRAAHPRRIPEHDFVLGTQHTIKEFAYTQQVWLSHTPLVIQADNPTLSASEHALLLNDFAKTACVVPLTVEEQPLGLLVLMEARSEMREPFDTEKLRLARSIGDQAASAIQRATLRDQIGRYALNLSMAYDETIEGWSRALDLRDKETEGHTQRVTEMTMRLARQAGLGDEQLVHIRRGALLHDIGKMGIPDAILLKPGALTDGEWETMRLHPAYAYELLSPIEYLRPALDIPYGHHEKWDGTGYPRGLRGEDIPLAARLFAVVDVWDALCSNRPYRAAWPLDRVRAYIRTLAGSHLDPQAVAMFLEFIH